MIKAKFWLTKDLAEVLNLSSVLDGCDRAGRLPNTDMILGLCGRPYFVDDLAFRPSKVYGPVELDIRRRKYSAEQIKFAANKYRKNS